MPSGVLLKLNFGLRRAIVGRNSIPLVSKTSQFSSRRSLVRSSMAASSSKAVFGDVHIDDMIATCGNGLEFSKPSAVFFSDRSRSSCLKSSVKMRNRELPNSRLVCGNFMLDAMRGNGKANNLVVGTLLKNLYSSSSVCFSAGAAQDVSFDGNSRKEQVVDSTVVSGQNTVDDRNLKLLSGSCYLPHPDKEETGGEDAHFICEDEQAIGVADGVGGWADVGVNAGEFSRELMSHSVSAIQEEPNGSFDPARVLEKAHAKTKAQGSSTACIITLNSEGIRAINLGDSGFMVVRDGCTIFRSPVQQHGFNFTYQLESGNGGDLPSSGQVFTVPVAPGDVIIAGTDGLFDNLYNNEVAAVVVHAIRTGLGPEAAAQKIAALARQRAVDRNQQTPFSTAAQDAGYRYYGGKLDDITVVVSYITNSANM
ncbi:hypothetical protein POPTR_005G125700v4 [Populus trichocarpa]|uniref:Protein phosphatase n=1 Tax=Populus trichocarpa TaxID=3694 RepID=U5GFI7_POPTR|nr:probable protein phosphatase 2C 80 isoform X1 [Populus trichocarpa]KAI5588599.1 hypothetical protein BDE02_05G108000 [Populus trichocarpa]PNT36418.1 hypothetical protein POPTR_005G125700v4 [Populus trichocarpa]|eukprot:XP_006383232.1 probable protein phosphatase 2C 80 isoform X1 [Populus trichocarpa]